MAKPSFFQLKQITDYLSEIEQLKIQITKATTELEKTKKDYALAEDLEKERLETEIKLRLLLESIDAELSQLRLKELEIKENLDKQILKAVDEYLNHGEFKNFVGDLLHHLEKNKIKYSVKISKNLSNLIPSGHKVSEIAEKNQFRIELEEKDYVLDIVPLKNLMYQKLLQEVLN